jgi:hypothetical protein
VKGPAAKAKVETTADAQGLLSQKLDAMLKDADGELMASLGNSIKILNQLLKLFLLLMELLLLKNIVKN